MNQNRSIIFLQASNNKEKLNHICLAAQKHFEQNSSLVIHVPDERSAKYVDDFLWKEPSTSFTPHVISNNSCNEIIVITTSPVNPNRASTLLNLCSSISSIVEQFRVVYEIMDETSEEKMLLSKLRHRQYQSANFL